MSYGFQRLVLLNSAGYQRAELPLDAAVSLVAPNNTGKTSLINALQFLLIIDKRRMDFGAYDVERSRRFYFPDNSAYILLEVLLPEAGTVVLGCVGRGVSYEYEYFAYRGQLDVDDYRLSDNSLVAQPQLVSHLASRGRLVERYNGTEFAAMVYGSGKRKRSDQGNFTVFRLEHPSQAEVFQRVLTRTLRLDQLQSKEVKEYLLQIFSRDLPDAGIDFKLEWDKAFADV
ncbi:MAG: ATP-binding protein, partial [Pseudomonadaceae bacterium]|nr:ATP-binding protein [Pseudomonadaceae bacterium]